MTALLHKVVDLLRQWLEQRTNRSNKGMRACRTTLRGTVLDTDPSAIEAVFARLSDKMLAGVAEATAELRPLKPIPNWRFDSFTEDVDLAVHVRHSLWLAAKARSGDIPVVVPWHCHTHLKLRLDNDLSRTLFSGGCFEPNEFCLIDQLLKPGMVFIDAGANEGLYTVFAAARVGEAGRVIAVEPSAREIRRLRQNLALNKFGSVEIIVAALAEHSGTVRLFLAEVEHSGQNTLGAAAYPGVAMVGEEEVAAITLDELAFQCGLTQLDVLKLDLEGAELRVLSSASRTLAELKPLILAEVNEAALGHQDGSVAGLYELLEAADYILLTFGSRGEPELLRQVNRPQSESIVAVHRDRDWGLLPKQAAPSCTPHLL